MQIWSILSWGTDSHPGGSDSHPGGTNTHPGGTNTHPGGSNSHPGGSKCPLVGVLNVPGGPQCPRWSSFSHLHLCSESDLCCADLDYWRCKQVYIWRGGVQCSHLPKPGRGQPNHGHPLHRFSRRQGMSWTS